MIGVKELYLKYKLPRVNEVKLGLWGRMINIISIPLTIPLLYTSITPNQITVLWIILGSLSCLFFIAGDYTLSIVGALLLNFAWVLDAVDGTIARYKNIKSENGNYLESIGHIFIDSLLMFCISLGAYNRYGNLLFLFLGYSAGVSILIWHIVVNEKILFFVEDEIFTKFINKKAAKLKLKTQSKTLIQKLYEFIIIFYHADFFFFILVILSILNAVPIFIVFYGITFPFLIVAITIYEVKRGYSWVYEFFYTHNIFRK